ncbi:MAG: MEDS domain-containing protein [Acidimicrobiales bacterium]
METHQQLEAGSHVVQFYERDEELIETVTEYLASGLRAGEVTIVVATQEHLGAFEVALRASGVEVDAHVARGEFVPVDVGRTLSEIMTADGPDIAAFDETIGSLVRQGALSGRRVRAYGELVALLWDAGQVNAAIEVESLWNDLGLRVPFTAFCAYRTRSVAGTNRVHELGKLCHLHTAIVGDVATLNERFDIAPTRTFVNSPQAPRDARRFVADVLQRWGKADLIDDASVVVSELATNAVLHAQSDFSVGMTLCDGGVSVAVSDASHSPPVQYAASATAASGRGVALVAALSDEWGSALTPAGKTVWAVLR